MLRVHYNKLIRDKIPDKIVTKGSQLETRTLDEVEFQKELRRKLIEEATEVANAKTLPDLIKELADLHIVIDEVKRSNQIYSSQVVSEKRKSLVAKGGFRKRLFLVWTSDDGYNSNETITGEGRS